MPTPELKVFRRSELELVTDGCLWRYSKLYREGVDDASDLSLIGIGGHAVMYAYLTRLVAKGIPQDIEEAEAAFVEGIAAVQTPPRLIPEVKHVWDYFVPYYTLPVDRFVAAESKEAHGQVGFTCDLVLAHPDRNELEICDWKWGWNPPLTEDALKALFQARVYARYGMETWPGFTTYRFTLVAARFNKFVSVVFSRADLDSVDLEVAAAVATIRRCEQTGQWPAVPGPACQWCELECPAVSQVGDLPKRLLEARQAQAVASWVLAGEAQLRSAKKALKAYVAGHGPVEVNGVVFDNRPAVSRAYPLIEVVNTIHQRNAAGAFDDQPFTIPASNLKKPFKAFPELEQALAGVATEKTTYRFASKRAGDEDTDEGDD